MILLDTHALVWARADANRLSAPARKAITQARHEGGVAVAAMSLYELARLFVRGHLQPSGTIEQAVSDLIEGVTVLPLTAEVAALATAFPRDFPRDPGDRLIAATARAYGVPLVTADKAIRASPLLRTIW